jgi:Family of unknown function (DUF5670)
LAHLGAKVRTSHVLLGNLSISSRFKKLKSGGMPMLWTLVVILFVLWLLGVVSSYTLGGFIHLLLVLALIVLIIQLITGRRVIT